MSDGTLDYSFNSPDGYNLINTLPSNIKFIDLFIQAIGIDSSGKIIVGSTVVNIDTDSLYLIIFRYNSNGTLDTSFGTGGYIIDQILSFVTILFSLTIDKDDNILVCGIIEVGSVSTGLICRYTKNGILDTANFNSPYGYTLTNNVGTGLKTTILSSIAIDSLGYIVSCGEYVDRNTVPETRYLLLTKYNNSGKIESSFGTSGYIIQRFLLKNTSSTSLVIDKDDNILLTGTVYLELNLGNYVFVAKYTSAGSLDTNNFNSPNGYTVMNYFEQGINTYSSSIVIDSLGYIVISSIYVNTNTVPNYKALLLVKYNSDGTVDNSFAMSGYFFRQLNDNTDTTALTPQVKIDRNNNIVCFSNDAINDIGKMLLFRVTYNGILDTTFNSPNGYVLTNFNTGQTAFSNGLYIDTNGKIVIYGFLINNDYDITNLSIGRFYGLPQITTTTTSTTIPPSTTTTIPPYAYVTVRFAINADYYSIITDSQSLLNYENVLIESIAFYTGSPKTSIDILSVTPGSIVNELRLDNKYVSILQSLVQYGLFYITINGVRYQAISSSFVIVDNICFHKGTNILTPSGYKLIEHLKIGDLVTSAQGNVVKIQKVTFFIGSREKCPLYVLHKNSLGNNVPSKDLYMSKGHAYRHNGKWCHMKCSSSSMEIDIDNIEYYNITLENYFTNTLVANGLEVESLFNMKGLQMTWKCETDNCKPIINKN